MKGLICNLMDQCLSTCGSRPPEGRETSFECCNYLLLALKSVQLNKEASKLSKNNTVLVLNVVY